MEIIPPQTASDIIEEKPKNNNIITLSKKRTNNSKSPNPIRINKSQVQTHSIDGKNQLQTSMISLNKSNISIQKIKFNKKQYEQYMFQKRYLISKTQYHKIISNLSDIDKKIKINNEIIESYNLNLTKLKENKKKKQDEIMELLANKESLEEIYQNNISALIASNDNKILKEKNDNINGQNANNENNNENDEQTNPNTNESNNNSNEENKGNDNENETHKKKESSSLSCFYDINNQIEIKVDDIKSSDQQKFEEQAISFVEEVLHKKDCDFNNKLKEKVKLTYQSFFSEINSSEDDIKNAINNFFLRISLFISNYAMANISEQNANFTLRELLKINQIGAEISELLKFLNKKYKESKSEIKENIRNLIKKNENLNVKKKGLELKKEELKLFMQENKEKYMDEKNKNGIEDGNVLYSSFKSDNDNNGIKNKRILSLKNKGRSSRNLLKEKSVRISKLNLDSLNNDMSISKDGMDNSDRQIIDNLNKYIINSMQINESNNKKNSLEDRTKKIVLHKNSFNNNGINVNNLLINNNINIENNNILSNTTTKEFNPQNVDEKENEIADTEQNIFNKKKSNMRIVYRSSRLKNEGKKMNSVQYNNTTNLQELLSTQKKSNSNNIIFLKDNKSNSFKNFNDLKSPSKITATQKRNHIYFQREDIKIELFSHSPNNTNSNNMYKNKTDLAKYSRNVPRVQNKVIPLNRSNFKLASLCTDFNKKTNYIPNNDKFKNKKIDISKIDKSNVYSKRYDNRLKILTQGIKESFCYFKFCEENHVEYNSLDGLLKTPENLDYVEGYISIDVFLHKFKIIPKIYKNKIINLKELMENLNKDIYLNGLNNDDEEDIHNINYIGIDLKQVIDIIISKEMKDIIKIYSTYMKYGGGQDKPDINKFISSREIKDIQMEQNEKMKAAFCKYFIFTLKFGKRASEKIEFIFINFEQFNLWYNCLDYIIKINNQIPKIVINKNYNIHGSPNKNKA